MLSVKERIEEHLGKHKKLHEVYVKRESESRKKLEKMRELREDCIYIDLLKEDVNSIQDLLKSNQKIIEELEKLKEEEQVVSQQRAAVFRMLRQQRQQRPQQRRTQLRRGLTPARIQKFDHFPADESLVGERCTICLGDIEVGRRMIRLDCKGHHVFCQGCVEGWFADHKTCPNCRHEF